jgi:hypothetical protein
LSSQFKHLKIPPKNRDHLIWPTCFIGYRMWCGKRLMEMQSNLCSSTHMGFDTSFWVSRYTVHGRKLIHASQPSDN